MSAGAKRLIVLERQLRGLFTNWRGLTAEFAYTAVGIAARAIVYTTPASNRKGAMRDFIAICRFQFDHECAAADLANLALQGVEPPTQKQTAVVH